MEKKPIQIKQRTKSFEIDIGEAVDKAAWYLRKDADRDDLAAVLGFMFGCDVADGDMPGETFKVTPVADKYCGGLN
jgi:hypothetical protein